MLSDQRRANADGNNANLEPCGNKIRDRPDRDDSFDLACNNFMHEKEDGKIRVISLRSRTGGRFADWWVVESVTWKNRLRSGMRWLAGISDLTSVELVLRAPRGIRRAPRHNNSVDGRLRRASDRRGRSQHQHRNYRSSHSWFPPRRRCLPGKSTSGWTTRMCRVRASFRENVFSSTHSAHRTFCLRALWIVSSCRVRSYGREKIVLQGFPVVGLMRSHL